MSKSLSAKELREALPAYLNHTLSAGERLAVEAALRDSDEARAELHRCRQLRLAVTNQPWLTPSAATRQKIMAQVGSRPQARRANARRTAPWLVWASGLALTLAITIVLWLIVQPGIGLQWSVSQDGLTAFRIYRAPAGSNRFTMVEEVPARPHTQDYAFVDTVLWPTRSCVYRIEGVGQAQAPVSQPVVVNGLEALPGQLTILLASLILGCATMYILQQLPVGHRPLRPLM